MQYTNLSMWDVQRRKKTASEKIFKRELFGALTGTLFGPGCKLPPQPLPENSARYERIDESERQLKTSSKSPRRFTPVTLPPC